MDVLCKRNGKVSMSAMQRFFENSVPLRRSWHEPAIRSSNSQVMATKKGKSWMIERELSEMNERKRSQDEGSSSQPESTTPEMSRHPVSSEEEKASAPREMVLQQCAKATLYFSIGGALLRFFALPLSDILPFADKQITYDLLQNPIEGWHFLLILALTMGITGARYLLQATVPDFALASDRSNFIALRNLNALDLVFVSWLPGFSEELLFRGALIPALGSQWPAMVLVAIIFGALHLGNGRNTSFVIWASFVGIVYGSSYLYTEDLLVPAIAHSFANLLSALLWKSRNQASLPEA